MIIGYDESTFGKMGQVVPTTVVIRECNNCHKTIWRTSWNNYKRRKLDSCLCISCRNLLGLQGNGFTGMRHTRETIELLKSMKLGVKKPSGFGENVSRRLTGKKASEDTKIKHSKMMIERYKDENYKKKIVTKLHENNGGRHSKLHQDVKETLTRSGINTFVSECYIGGYFADELDNSRKLIIEVNGTYWHADKRFYSDDAIIHNGGRGMFAREIWARDKEKIDRLEFLGYKLFIVWQHDWHKNRDIVMGNLSEWYCQNTREIPLGFEKK